MCSLSGSPVTFQDPTSLRVMSTTPTAPSNPPRLTRRKTIALVLLVWGVILAGAEGAARIRLALGGRNQGARYSWIRNTRLSGEWARQEREHPYLPYLPKVKTPDIDMLGLRLTEDGAAKPDDVFRIFCLGGSTTHRAFPAKLQAKLERDLTARGLRLEIVDAANISWTSAESLINFAIRCLPYEPDAVIIYHAVNDCWPAFGKTWRADYTHWRKRLVPQKPLRWDHLPRFLDRSAAFVLFRSWFEIPARYEAWKFAMMRYVPDFENDPYHGLEPFRRNMSNLLAIARTNDIPVLLSTQVYNAEEPAKRLVQAVREANDITRTMAAKHPGVVFVDAADAIKGSYELLVDICHFRHDRDGEERLVGLFADAIRANLDEWLEASREQAAPGTAVVRRVTEGLPREEIE